MSNKFDDENLDDLKEVDKKKRMLGRYDEKVVKKLGYDDCGCDDRKNALDKKVKLW